MDFATFIPTVAAHLHVQPSTLVFWLVALNVGARAVARRIPSDAVGFWGFVRQSAAILGVEVQSRATTGVTTAAAARAVVATPQLAEKIAAAKGVAPAAPVEP